MKTIDPHALGVIFPNELVFVGAVLLALAIAAAIAELFTRR